MDIKDVMIVADSSADLISLDGVNFCSAPLKIITAQREFVDDATLDVEEMADYLYSYKGRSQSSCPSPEDWLCAFGEAKYVFCVAITSGLSGSYNSACCAKNMYEEAYPERKVFVLDSLSAGPELTLIAEKMRELVLAGKDFDDICAEVEAYSKKTGLLFILESLNNFANNGRIKPIVAKAVGLMGIRLVGKASDEGQLQPLDKCRGSKKAMLAVVEYLKQNNFSGRVKLHHCFNADAANALAELIRAEFPNAVVEIAPQRGLCSFYAEKGGLLVGYEKA